jgi:hypothetical protein
MIVVVPAIRPVTMPDVRPTTALELLAIHVPPADALVRKVDWLSQTCVAPDNGAGSGYVFTVTTL